MPASSSVVVDLDRVRSAILIAFAESRQSHGTLRLFGLVALGEKPASLRTFERTASGGLRFGFGSDWWDPGDFLAALGAAGLDVHRFPSYDSPVMDTVVVSPGAARSRRIERLLSTQDPDSLLQPDRRLDLRLGALLGHPRSAREAYVGIRDRAARAGVRGALDARDDWFVDGVIDAAEPGFSEGTTRFARMGSAFRAAFGDLWEGQARPAIDPPARRESSTTPARPRDG